MTANPPPGYVRRFDHPGLAPRPPRPRTSARLIINGIDLSACTVTFTVPAPPTTWHDYHPRNPGPTS